MVAKRGRRTFSKRFARRILRICKKIKTEETPKRRNSAEVFFYAECGGGVWR